MTGARTRTLASLRGSIERIETHDAFASSRAALGHAGADVALQGGLALGAVHEVFAEGRQSAAATGFLAGLAGRASARRPLVWVRQDFTEIESGAISMNGLAELGPGGGRGWLVTSPLGLATGSCGSSECIGAGAG